MSDYENECLKYLRKLRKFCTKYGALGKYMHVNVIVQRAKDSGELLENVLLLIIFVFEEAYSTK